MLAKDKERGERKRTGRDRGGWEADRKGTNRKTGRGRWDRGRQQRNRKKRNRQRQTGNKQTERWGKGETDGGSQRTSCYVVKMDHFTSFRIICMVPLDCVELKSYNISMQIMCRWDFETSYWRVVAGCLAGSVMQEGSNDMTNWLWACRMLPKWNLGPRHCSRIPDTSEPLP